jgi:hypothetical protein
MPEAMSNHTIAQRKNKTWAERSCNHDRDVFDGTPHNEHPVVIAFAVNGNEKKSFRLVAELCKGKSLVPGDVAVDVTEQ